MVSRLPDSLPSNRQLAIGSRSSTGGFERQRRISHDPGANDDWGCENSTSQAGCEDAEKNRVTSPRFTAKKDFAWAAPNGIFIRMLTEYLNAAMARAHYELLGGGEGFYGEIPGFQGVLAQADTLEACRRELASTLEDWLLFRISRQLPVPMVEGLDLTIKESPAFA